MQCSRQKCTEYSPQKGCQALIYAFPVGSWGWKLIASYLALPIAHSSSAQPLFRRANLYLGQLYLCLVDRIFSQDQVSTGHLTRILILCKKLPMCKFMSHTSTPEQGPWDYFFGVASRVSDLLCAWSQGSDCPSGFTTLIIILPPPPPPAPPPPPPPSSSSSCCCSELAMQLPRQVYILKYPYSHQSDKQRSSMHAPSDWSLQQKKDPIRTMKPPSLSVCTA